MSKLNIYLALQLKAYKDYFLQSDEYFHRKICRWYSKTFSTPLHEVLNGVISWEEILTHYYENQLELLSHDDVYDSLRNVLPDLIKEDEQVEEEFAQNLVNLQNQSLERSKVGKDNPQTYPPLETSKNDVKMGVNKNNLNEKNESTKNIENKNIQNTENLDNFEGFSLKFDDSLDPEDI
jgi:hypothetical protein